MNDKAVGLAMLAALCGFFGSVVAGAFTAELTHNFPAVLGAMASGGVVGGVLPILINMDK